MNPSQVFSKILMVPDFSRGHHIYWAIDPFFKGVLPYNFTLQISQTVDFSEIAKEIFVGDHFFGVDNTGYKQNWTANYYYRVMLETGDGQRFFSTSINFDYAQPSQRKFAMAAELIRKEFLLCRYAGRTAWILKRKSYGQVAEVTIDPISGVPIADEKCVDYGVGLTDGYFKPVPAAFVIDRASTDKQMDPSGLGVKSLEDLSVRMPGYPLLDERDIVCANLEGRRYNVLSKEQTYFPGTGVIIYQTAVLRLIPSTDTVYNIKIPDDLYDPSL